MIVSLLMAMYFQDANPPALRPGESEPPVVARMSAGRLQERERTTICYGDLHAVTEVYAEGRLVAITRVRSPFGLVTDVDLRRISDWLAPLVSSDASPVICEAGGITHRYSSRFKDNGSRSFTVTRDNEILLR